jgi:phospholipase D1/2
VFLIDPDFNIERPKRAFRQGLKRLTGQGSLKAAVGYNTKEGEGNNTSTEDKNLHEIAAAAGSGQALTKEQQKKLNQHSKALGEGDSRDASQHTFYINSSQRRLKLVAKNVVGLSMLKAVLSYPASRCIPLNSGRCSSSSYQWNEWQHNRSGEGATGSIRLPRSV